MKSTPKKREWFALAFVGIVLVFGGWVFYSTQNSMPPTTPSNQVEQQTYTEIDAYLRAKGIVESFLKAPATAKFESYQPSMAIRGENSTYRVSFYVDSQNSFGAMLRSRWIVQLQFLEDWQGKINIISVSEDGKTIYP